MKTARKTPRKITKEITSIILTLVLVLSMTASAFATAENPSTSDKPGGIMVVLGDSVATGMTDKYEYVSGFTRLIGSSGDVAANELGMGVVNCSMVGMGLLHIRSLFEPDYYPEYDYLRVESRIAQNAATVNFSYNQLGEYIQNWASQADFITIQAGTVDLLYAIVMDAFWELEETLGIDSEKTTTVAPDRNAVYTVKSQYSLQAWDVRTTPDYVGVARQINEPGQIEDFTPENFDLEQWFRNVETKLASESVESENLDIQDIVNILVSLYNIASNKNLLPEFLEYLADSIVGRCIQYETDYRAVINDIYALNPDVTIALISETSPFAGITGLYGNIPCELKYLIEDEFSEMNQGLIRMAADNNCLYVDGSDCELSCNYDVHTVVSYLTGSDPDVESKYDILQKVHPNTDDYERIGHRIAAAYRAYLAGTYEAPASTGIGQSCIDIYSAVEDSSESFFRFDFSGLFNGLDRLSTAFDSLSTAFTKTSTYTHFADACEYLFDSIYEGLFGLSHETPGPSTAR